MCHPNQVMGHPHIVTWHTVPLWLAMCDSGPTRIEDLTVPVMVVSKHRILSFHEVKASSAPHKLDITLVIPPTGRLKEKDCLSSGLQIQSGCRSENPS